MKKWVLSNKFLLVGGILGALAGYLYWKYWGCVNGCTITSSPRNSTLYFALIGALLFGTFKKQTHAGKE
jgi:hypothetical protein